jgi:hypothetical protein
MFLKQPLIIIRADITRRKVRMAGADNMEYRVERKDVQNDGGKV